MTDTFSLQSVSCNFQSLNYKQDIIKSVHKDSFVIATTHYRFYLVK